MARIILIFLLRIMILQALVFQIEVVLDAPRRVFVKCAALPQFHQCSAFGFQDVELQISVFFEKSRHEFSPSATISAIPSARY